MPRSLQCQCGVLAGLARLAVTQVLTVVAAAILVAASIQVLYRLVAPFTLVLAIGASCWLVGNAAWLAGGALTAAVPWWPDTWARTIGQQAQAPNCVRSAPVTSSSTWGGDH